jgi:hypothetical protein
MEFLAVYLLVSTEDYQQTCAVKDVARTTQSDLRIFMVESRIKDMSETIDDLGRSQGLYMEGKKKQEMESATKYYLPMLSCLTTHQRHTANLLIRSLPAQCH